MPQTKYFRSLFSQTAKYRAANNAIKRNGPSHKAQAVDRIKNILEREFAGVAGREYRFSLIDYRNNNEIIKKKVMTYRDAYDRNKIISGTGMA